MLCIFNRHTKKINCKLNVFKFEPSYTKILHCEKNETFKKSLQIYIITPKVIRLLLYQKEINPLLNRKETSLEILQTSSY